MLSGRGLCDELITRPEESYRLWCVVVCDLETSKMRRPWPELGRSPTGIYIARVIRLKHFFLMTGLLCTIIGRVTELNKKNSQYLVPPDEAVAEETEKDMEQSFLLSHISLQASKF